MSGEGPESPVGCEAAPGGGDKKRDSLGTAGSPAHFIIKDLGEIHSRLLDHRPVIQGEIRYFVKEFEEKRGLRELRVLENLKNMIQEANEHALPTCRDAMQGSLEQVLQRLHAAANSVCGLQQREQAWRKIHSGRLVTSEKQHVAQWEALRKEQHAQQAAVDAEHREAVARLKEQYAAMEKDLAKLSTFSELEPQP